MRISDHFTYLLRNLFAGQEAAVKIGHGTADMEKQLELDMVPNRQRRMSRLYIVTLLI